ncbi:MAG: hypothetical protein ACXWOA_19585 [Isosphaeraceae bacterium]
MAACSPALRIVPTTRAPLQRAIRAAAPPTAPVTPVIRIVSPARSPAASTTAAQAVM